MDNTKCILIFDEISPELLKRITEETKDIPDGANLTLEIASYGGTLLDGLAIIEKLRRFHTTADVLFACSAAAIIALSCERVVMHPDSLLMIHSAYAEENDHEDDGITCCNNVMMKIIHERNPSISESVLSQDTWLNAEKCLKLNLCDNINNNVNQKYVAIGTKIAAKLNIPFKNEVKQMDEKELIEQLDEKIEKDAEPEVEAEAEENHDIVEVIEQLSQRLEGIEARLVALEDVCKQPEEAVEKQPEAECEDNKEQERLNALYKAIARPQARVGVSIETTRKVHKISNDLKKFINLD